MKAEGFIERVGRQSTDEKPTLYECTITTVGTKLEIDFFMKNAFSASSDIHQQKDKK